MRVMNTEDQVQLNSLDRSSRESQRTIMSCSVCSDNACFVLVNTLVTDERTRKRSEQDMLPSRANDSEISFSVYR